MSDHNEELASAPNPFGDGLRNLRPELDPQNNVHRAYWTPPDRYDVVAARLRELDALHRLAFVTAAAVADGFFIDIRQSSAEVPYPEDGRTFAAIIGDREVSTAGIVSTLRSRGPDFYHQPSLRKLFGLARSVTVDWTGQGLAPIYASACKRTAANQGACILVETTDFHGEAWVNFVNKYTTNCQYSLVADQYDPVPEGQPQ